LQAEIDSIIAALPVPDETEGKAAIRRLILLSSTINAHRDSDGVLFTSAMIDNVYSPLQTYVMPELRQFAADPGVNGASLNSAATSIDLVLEPLALWPDPAAEGGAALAAAEAVRRYDESVAVAVESLRERVTQAEAEVATLKASTDAQSKSVEDLTKQLTDGAAEEIRAAADRLVQDNADITEPTREDMRATLRQAREDAKLIDILKISSQKTSSAFSRWAIAEDYGRNARNKAVSGWVWDVLGFLVGGVALAILLWHFFQPSASSNDSVPVGITRLAISVAAVGLATLCFRRGRDNHQESRISKRAEIRLKTAETFLANQDPEVQAAVLEGMAERIYLRGQLDPDADEPEENLRTLIARVTARRDKSAPAASTE